MVKKELSSHFPYIAIIGLVAIVAVVVLVLNIRIFTFDDSVDTVGVVDEEGNFVGEAARVGDKVVLNKGLLLPAVQKCPTGLKDYEISADVTTISADDKKKGINMAADFNVNGVKFRLTQPVGFRKVLNAGEAITLQRALLLPAVQDVDGELHGLEFTFEKACQKEYTIRAYERVSAGLDFRMDGEEFKLNIGESHVLQDGTKVILKDDRQGFTDGHVKWGVSLELICQG